MLKQYTKDLPAAVFGRDNDDYPLAKTARGRRWDRFMRSVRESIGDPAMAAKIEADNIRLRGLTPGNTQVVQLLQNMSVMYANDELIGERLMPIVQVAESQGLSVDIGVHDQANKFDYPLDTMPGGQVNEVSENVTITPVALSKFGLAEHIDIWNQNMSQNVVADLIDPTMNVLDGMDFNRELRIATILSNAGNFGANTAAVAAADRWNTPGGGNPGAVVDTAKAACFTGSSGLWVGYCTEPVYRALKRNPVVLDCFKYGGNAPRFATREMLAEYFELDELLVGKFRRITTQEGQAATYGRLWNTNVFGVLRVANNPTRRSASFGITLAQARAQMSWMDPTTGGKGAYWTKVACAEVSSVLAAPCGYLITTPI